MSQNPGERPVKGYWLLATGYWLCSASPSKRSFLSVWSIEGLTLKGEGMLS